MTTPVTPERQKSYPAVVSPESARVRFALTPSAADKKNVVYAIEDDRGMPYVGKSEQVFKNRMQQHESCVNTKRARGKTKLYSAIRECPERFSVRILAQGTPETLSAKEVAFIEQLDAQKNGYNMNRGGGGGSSAESDDLPFVPPVKTTPEKYFPLKKRSDGTVGVDFTPRTARSKRGLYVVRNIETGERYVGKTKRKLSMRIREHLNDANHPEKERGQKRLSSDIREKTDQFAVGVLQQVDVNASLNKAERHFIRIKRSKETGYNGNAGGGGSC